MTVAACQRHLTIPPGDRLHSSRLHAHMRALQFGAPAPLAPGAGVAELAAGVQALLDILVANGFAIKVRVVPWCVAPCRYAVGISWWGEHAHGRKPAVAHPVARCAWTHAHSLH